MTNEMSNVPELRFPEFDGEWEEKMLGEVTIYKNGGSFENSVKNHGVFNLITLKSVNTEGELINSGKYIDDKSTETLCKGTLVMILSEQAPGLVGMTANITRNNKYVLNQRVAALVPKQGIDSQFLSKLINRNQKYFSVRSAGTKVKNISKGHVENFNFLAPNYTEQQKIGNFFSKLDRQIELEEQKLSLLEEQKKGYMQKIFSQELRFKDENGDDYTEWEKKELGDILTILDGDRGGNYPHSTDFSVQGHTLFLSATNVTKKGFSFKQNQYITEKKSNSMGKGKLVENDIILTTRGSLGNIAWYNKEISKLIPFVRINSGMLILRTNDTRKSIFVTQILKSPLGKRQIDLISFGSAQPQLTKKDVKSYKINLPETKEQQKIGDFFSELDKLVEKQSAKLNRLKVRKQGFLQKMFV